MAKVKSKIIQNGNVNYVYATLNGIDTSNVLATYSGSNYSYTAIQDCFMFIRADQLDLYIDGVYLNFDRKVNIAETFGLYIKKGQVVSVNAPSGSRTDFYGIKR